VENVMAFIRIPPRVKCKMIEKQEAESKKPLQEYKVDRLFWLVRVVVVPRMMIVARGKRKDDPSFLSSTTGIIGQYREAETM
jgi:hypothetical protein